MGNLCCCFNGNDQQKKIVLLLVGLDNAGKSVAVKGLAGESIDTVVPTVGLSVVYLKFKEYDITIFDLGGGSNIRGIWQRYFVDAHGIIFVVDASDYQRLEEARDVLRELLSHDKIAGKPVLLLANKQDQQEALDELDLVEKLEIEELVNRKKCPTLVETCSATTIMQKSKVDPGIQKGYHWLINFIIREYHPLNLRVEKDVQQQQVEEQEERMEKITRLRQLNAQKKPVDDDLIESYSDYVNGNASTVPPNDLDDSKDVFVIRAPNFNTNVETRSFSSSKSDESFPFTYYRNEPQERPRSARQFVKEQIELDSTQRKINFKTLTSNKTAPVNLYGCPHPRSAVERRRHFLNDRRALKSAGDSVFVSSVHNSADFVSMDGIHNALFHLNNFHQSQKLPAVKFKAGDDDRWAHKSPVSVINLQ